jgi:hypothetical protein
MLNFKCGTKLAVQQDTYMKMLLNGDKISKSQIQDLKDNLWVKIAAKLAPNNLVIRQYCLIDILEYVPKNKNKILKLLNTLSYNEKSDYKCWAEGYSYFNYVLDFLNVWMDWFHCGMSMSEFYDIINQIKQGFIATSYKRNDTLYPAPYGDLRDVPLSADLQIGHSNTNIRLSNLIVNYNNETVDYKIIARPLGFNTHIPKKDAIVKVINGLPQPFKFYEGYDKKYKNVVEEIIDTFAIKRILSLFFKIGNTNGNSTIHE